MTALPSSLTAPKDGQRPKLGKTIAMQQARKLTLPDDDGKPSRESAWQEGRRRALPTNSYVRGQGLGRT
jgi:hypothetical protein